MSKASIQERKEYLKKKVNPIIETMMADLMLNMPEDIVSIFPDLKIAFWQFFHRNAYPLDRIFAEVGFNKGTGY